MVPRARVVEEASRLGAEARRVSAELERPWSQSRRAWLTLPSPCLLGGGSWRQRSFLGAASIKLPCWMWSRCGRVPAVFATRPRRTGAKLSSSWRMFSVGSVLWRRGRWPWAVQKRRCDERKKYLDQLRALQVQLEEAEGAQGRAVDVRGSADARLNRDSALMQMLKDLFRSLSVAMERGKFGPLSAGLDGNVLEPAQYVLRMFPVAEVIEGVSARIPSTVEAECRQLLAKAITELLVVALANDAQFPVEYVVQAEATDHDFREHKDCAEALAKQFTVDFVRGAEKE